AARGHGIRSASRRPPARRARGLGETRIRVRLLLACLGRWPSAPHVASGVMGHPRSNASLAGRVRRDPGGQHTQRRSESDPLPRIGSSSAAGGGPVLRIRASSWWASAIAIALLAGCGNKSGPNSNPGGGGPGGSAAIVRIEVTPSSVLLSGAGQRHPLTAKAFNAQGAEVPTTFTWTSSKPDQVSVDASGTLQAVTAIGSATAQAQAGTVRSPAVAVATVQPRPGAVLLTDSQVVDAGTPFI